MYLLLYCIKIIINVCHYYVQLKSSLCYHIIVLHSLHHAISLTLSLRSCSKLYSFATRSIIFIFFFFMKFATICSSFKCNVPLFIQLLLHWNEIIKKWRSIIIIIVIIIILCEQFAKRSISLHTNKQNDYDMRVFRSWQNRLTIAVFRTRCTIFALLCLLSTSTTIPAHHSSLLFPFRIIIMNCFGICFLVLFLFPVTEFDWFCLKIKLDDRCQYSIRYALRFALPETAYIFFPYEKPYVYHACMRFFRFFLLLLPQFSMLSDASFVSLPKRFIFYKYIPCDDRDFFFL